MPRPGASAHTGSVTAISPDDATDLVRRMYGAFGRRDLRQLGQLLDPEIGFALGDPGEAWEEGSARLLDRLASVVNASDGTAAAVLDGVYSDGGSRVIAFHRELATWHGGRHETSGCLLVTVSSGHIQTLERFRAAPSATLFRESTDAPASPSPDTWHRATDIEGDET